MQQVECELLVVGDVELLHIDLREDVEGCTGFDGGDAGDVVERLVYVIALLAYAASGHHVVAHALMAPQSGLDDGLRRHVGAQAHIRQHVQAQDEVLRAIFLAGQHHPTDAIAGNHVRLRKTREGDAEQVGSKACDGYVLKVVHDQAVIDLIG